MSAATEIFSALASLVSSRVYPDAFPQDTAWPAIRYTFVSAVPAATICGSGTDEVTDYRVQIDVVCKTGVQRDQIRLAVQAAMRTLPTPNVADIWATEYDETAKAYIARMDFFIEPSST
ncbi:MAG: DUF3168 domain-containing protein [Planctomycetota bacterium]